MLSRWTGESLWIPDTEPPPRGWYPYHRTSEMPDPVLNGRYCRQRKRWWVLIVVFRIFKQAWNLQR